MVLLTMTIPMVATINFTRKLSGSLESKTEEPPLDDPAVGQPISHGQVLSLYECLKAVQLAGELAGICPTYHLDDLLRGSRVYIAPVKPRPEQSSEYKALMARLRREEEFRAYDRMINPPHPRETFAQRFPGAPQNPFGGDRVTKAEEAEEITYADINRQVALIFNILISIVACSAAIWMAAHQWSVPSRLGLSMGGGGTVGIAEVVVYAGYLRRIHEAKIKEGKKVEVKEIVDTWVIGGPANDTIKEEQDRGRLAIGPEHESEPTLIPDIENHSVALRKRKS